MNENGYGMGHAWVTEDRWNSREKQSDLGVHCLYTIIGLFDRQIVFVRMSVLIWIQTITQQWEIIWTKKNTCQLFFDDKSIYEISKL